MIGRAKEQQVLKNLALSGEAEFVVVYGRRRVGKTYLVRETFENTFFFSYTGIARVSAGKQIARFENTLRTYGWSGHRIRTWFDAFGALRELIAAGSKDEPLIVFIDEMPWMDNKKSDFISAFEHFWNGWASGVKNLTLIACGSATSWITKKIFKNKGGLYNRVTRQIKLKPFTLAECKAFYDAKGIVMNTHDMVESYMVFGGIPYYLNMFEKSFSLVLNVDALCFSEDAPLRGEFDQLYETLFSSPERHVQVVKALAASRQGLNRGQIVAAIDFSDGGGLTRALNELEQCGFIRSYKAYGKNERGKLYQLCDEFSAFHLNFIAQHSSPKYWSSSIESGVRRAWSGFAFEQVCLAHVEQIKQALGISGVLTDISAWQGKDDENKGAQIDLVIERNDQVINLCEMKYSAELFQVDKALDAKLRDRAAIFRRATKTRKALHQTLVTTYGIAHNSWSSAFQSVVTMEDLLR